jgi:hypothetical protein
MLAKHVNRWAISEDGTSLIICTAADDLDDPFVTIPLSSSSSAQIIVGLNPSG